MKPRSHHVFRRPSGNPSRHLLMAVATGGLLCSPSAFAGPPFMTDDPEPIERGRSEAYLFSTYDKGPQGDKTFAAPAFEFNTSPVEDVHLHAMLPFLGVHPGDGRNQYGMGDIELGIKYRFLHETDLLPQAGIFPMFYVPTGDADKGLGNGRSWGTFPLWLQKSFGDWTTYGGGGRAFNTAPGMRDYNFGGWLLQRTLNERLIIGGEIFAQGAPDDEARHATFFNLGGVYRIGAGCGDCSLLFRVGSTIAGEHHDGAYLGLYWNWGPAE